MGAQRNKSRILSPFPLRAVLKKEQYSFSFTTFLESSYLRVQLKDTLKIYEDNLIKSFKKEKEILMCKSMSTYG